MIELSLDGTMKKHISAYSPGVKQRLRLAQAITEEPDLLILNEPINAFNNDTIK